MSSTATAAASRLVPPIVAWLAPSTVVDVGCGEGAWLAELIAAGCGGIGVDGPFVDADRLLIPSDTFVTRDLERPVALGRRFDLALCLEVAEHLSPGRADGLVDDLVALSDRVLLSAATRGQGGYGHVNEQPHEYWVERFEDRGYATTGVLRRRFAGDDEVASWYRAKLLLFARVQPARQDAE